jgi:hypothetical protein
MADKFSNDPLKTKLPRPSFGLLRGTTPEGEQEWALCAQEAKAKLHLLANEIGIDLEHPEGWRCLALALAMKHEPGFKFANKKQAERWNLHSKRALYHSMQPLIDKGRSINSAAHVVANRVPWVHWLHDLNEPAETLRKQYETIIKDGLGQLLKNEYMTDDELAELVAEHITY